MSGHSKWANIKRKKGKNDAVRGKITTKISREITIAVRMGGADPTGNMRLKLALQKAKENNIPKENINRAIQKGAGTLEGQSYEEIVYEGYGPAGVALTVNVLTDNRNRAAADVRHLFSKHGGNMGETGCVSWMFKNLGLFVVAKDAVDEDKLMEVALMRVPMISARKATSMKSLRRLKLTIPLNRLWLTIIFLRNTHKLPWFPIRRLHCLRKMHKS